MARLTIDPRNPEAAKPMTREERLAQTGDCPAEYPDQCPDIDTCPVHDDGTLFPPKEA